MLLRDGYPGKQSQDHHSKVKGSAADQPSTAATARARRLLRKAADSDAEQNYNEDLRTEQPAIGERTALPGREWWQEGDRVEQLDELANDPEKEEGKKQEETREITAVYVNVWIH